MHIILLIHNQKLFQWLLPIYNKVGFLKRFCERSISTGGCDISKESSTGHSRPNLTTLVSSCFQQPPDSIGAGRCIACSLVPCLMQYCHFSVLDCLQLCASMCFLDVSACVYIFTMLISPEATVLLECTLMWIDFKISSAFTSTRKQTHSLKAK